jgi:hypothetical protein
MSRPTILEAAGGSPAFEALTVRFYEKVRADQLLSPVFASFTAEHAAERRDLARRGLRRPATLLRGAWAITAAFISYGRVALKPF